MTAAPRIDVLTIFPDYLAPLELSLVGKARRSGLVDLRVRDLRAVTTDRHRTVDDSPLGGGAGMVMKPDVWWRAIVGGAALPDGAASPGGAVSPGEGEPPEAVEDADERGLVVLVPTPSGAPLTQASAERLAAELSSGGVRAVIACGRYEGIDGRLVERLATAPGVARVEELSLGDYVLNGGEVAALALVEAVVRLLPGVVGNPESVVEESFATHTPVALLEYPVYTRPASWEGIEAPPVLLSGNHAEVARWRRDASLRRTAQRRPDLLTALDPDAVSTLEARDLEVLASERVVLGRHGRLLGPLGVRRAGAGDAAILADLAAVTFPLACPDSTTLGEVRAHVAEHLSLGTWRVRLQDPGQEVLVLADHTGEALGYALVLLGGARELSLETVVRDAVGPDGEARTDGAGPQTGDAELSKLYLLPRARGTGAADILLGSALGVARERGARGIWLGTNEGNAQARAAYARHGFAVVGTRTFHVGGGDHHDVVMWRALPGAEEGPGSL